MRSEIGGAVLDKVAGGEIEAVFTAVTHKGANLLQRKNPELTYDEAAALAALGTIATISAGSSLASKIGPILKKWDLKHVKNPADVKLHETHTMSPHAEKEIHVDTDKTFEVKEFLDKKDAKEAYIELNSAESVSKFFSGATSKSKNFKVIEFKDGSKRLEFFSPANTPGYGKRYIQEIDANGNLIKEFKETIGPDGNVLNTKLLHDE
ncbi:hypothetical protein MIDIC_240071 [Alphaproteobacteria bacterium]